QVFGGPREQQPPGIWDLAALLDLGGILVAGATTASTQCAGRGIPARFRSITTSFGSCRLASRSGGASRIVAGGSAANVGGAAPRASVHPACVDPCPKQYHKPFPSTEIADDLTEAAFRFLRTPRSRTTEPPVATATTIRRSTAEE
ncbi:unnamed protein product, partial [Symbiodinium microadriaticum]